MEELTSKQKEIFNFILKRIKERSQPPTLREIASHFHFTSTGTVRDYLRALVSKGYIKVGARKARAIALTREAFLAKETLFKIPILGRIPAGGPDLAVEDIEGYLDWEWLSKGKEGLFALRVKGDSMVKAGIMEGDLAIVRKQLTCQSGDIVVAMVDGEATVKRFRRLKSEIQLEPANPNYKPIVVKGEFQLVGKVILVIRRYV